MLLVALEALENSAQTMLVHHSPCIQEMAMQKLFFLQMGMQPVVHLHSTIGLNQSRPILLVLLHPAHYASKYELFLLKNKAYKFAKVPALEL